MLNALSGRINDVNPDELLSFLSAVSVSTDVTDASCPSSACTSLSAKSEVVTGGVQGSSAESAASFSLFR
ncbi:MAG: class II lanthipeptide, LchA2/BrtA2 family [Oscillospiraceae bacterium]